MKEVTHYLAACGLQLNGLFLSCDTRVPRRDLHDFGEGREGKEADKEYEMALKEHTSFCMLQDFLCRSVHGSLEVPYTRIHLLVSRHPQSSRG